MRRLKHAAIAGLLLAVLVQVGCGGPSIFPASKARTTITPARAVIIEFEVPTLPAPDPAPTGPIGALYTLVGMAAIAQTQSDIDAAGRLLERMPPGTKGRVLIGESAGLTTTDGQVVEGFNAEVPSLGTARHADTSSIAGGAVGFVARRLGVPTRAAGLFIVGALVLAGGAVAFVYGARRIALGLVVGGGALIGAGWLADNAGAVLGVAMLVGLGYIVWTIVRDKTGGDAEAALAAVSGAIEDEAKHDPAAAERIKDQVKARMGAARDRLNRAVDRAKRRAGK